MFIPIVAAAAVAAVWKHRVYKRWKLYNSTICYMILCNFLYYFFVKKTLRWEYHNAGFSHGVSELIISFIIFPCTVMLYLDGIDNATNKAAQVKQLVKWILIYLFVEFIAWKLHVIIYDHDWSYAWSILFVCTMFPMLLLHHRHALVAYLLSVGVIAFYLNVFHIPIR